MKSSLTSIFPSRPKFSLSGNKFAERNKENNKRCLSFLRYVVSAFSSIALFNLGTSSFKYSYKGSILLLTNKELTWSSNILKYADVKLGLTPCMVESISIVKATSSFYRLLMYVGMFRIFDLISDLSSVGR
ncbi:hypothetical protein EDF67_106181 [Sphingobacterium sp. JUb78]|nr:hypothetical protein [Sphingobacterium kitahiroshimense]TCR09016.1 hypothetical protein EDF67_106181 [Sphingobacterium sp. JUb78]